MKSLKPDLVVESIERSVAFYRDVLEFEVSFAMSGPDGKLAHAEVQHGAAAIMLDRIEWAPEVAQLPRGAGMTLYVEVGDIDIDAYYERIRARGATIAQEIQDQFWGHRHFAVRDPDGYHLSFAKPIREVSAEEMASVLSKA